MLLISLELAGFKSFAKKTVFDFRSAATTGSAKHQGITAIVGPNGSGKSNVADAVRFVLGEQSTKSLRGKKGEDVIFAGTEKAGKLGSASVTLVLDNSTRILDSEDTTVRVMRRVHRSGEGEYRINDTKVRLQDVVDLCARAGITKDSYAVMTQGMSDALLRATPRERCSIIEEAAGVRAKQIEKERATRRLIRAEDNIGRLQTLITEIEPGLRSLRRTAEKASRKDEIANRRRDLQTNLYALDWSRMSRADSEYQTAQKSLATEMTILNTQKKEISEKLQAVEKLVFAGADSAQQKLRTTLATTNAEIQKLEQRAYQIQSALALEAQRREPRTITDVFPVDTPYIREGLASAIGLTHELSSLLTPETLDQARATVGEVATSMTTLSNDVAAGSIQKTRTITLPEAELAASLKREEALKQESETLKVEREKLQDTKKTLTAELDTVVAGESTQKEQYNTWRTKERELEDKLRSAMMKQNTLEVEFARTRVYIEELAARVQADLGIKLAALPTVFDPTLGGRDRAQVEQEIRRHTSDLEQIGAIDPLTLAEYAETEARYGSMTREVEELTYTAEQLRKTKGELEKIIQTEFEKTFAEVAKNFEKYFALIFAGGKAKLTLVKVEREVEAGTDSDDTLFAPQQDEWGVELSATPPGKKTHDLALLSGGEKSLVALALLFAVVAHNPPPFALLDEVEAALDEANSKRFNTVLEALSPSTQFIVITHNRETMAAADRIYGVTLGSDATSEIMVLDLPKGE